MDEATKRFTTWIVVAAIAVAAAVTNPDATKFQSWTTANGFFDNAEQRRNCYARQTTNLILVSLYYWGCDIDIASGPNGRPLRGTVGQEYIGVFNNFIPIGDLQANDA